jgi:hypothetical protein
MTELAAFTRHLRRFGPEAVFETATGLGEAGPELELADLANLAREPGTDPRRPLSVEPLIAAAGELYWRAHDGGIELDAEAIAALAVPFPAELVRGVAAALEFTPDRALAERCARIVCARGRYAKTVAAVLAASSTPRGRARSCEVCGVPIVGRSDRRTCSAECRKRLSRARRPERPSGPLSRPRRGEADRSRPPDRSHLRPAVAGEISGKREVEP